jgi:hypothetical protein
MVPVDDSALTDGELAVLLRYWQFDLEATSPGHVERGRAEARVAAIRAEMELRGLDPEGDLP